jgi:PRTRC genetic system protein F
MPRPANHGRIIRRCSRRQRSHFQPHATRRPARLAAAGQLMARGAGLLLPRLTGVPLIHRVVADDRRAVMLAKSLVELDIAVPGDWERAEADPTSFTRLTLERWIKAHGGPAIRRRFLLVATISDTPCEWAERDETRPNRLFLTVEPSEANCGCVTFGPTLELLENVHPQLPATFFNLFVRALNRYIRTYDHRDAEERAETLREWAAQEADADQYEIPDVEGSIPPCMRMETLNECELACLKDKINDPLVTKLVNAVLALDHLSAQAKRPELDDDIGQQLSDCNPPLPCLLAVFAEADAIAACFDEEAEGMMEVTPEPNLIIPFDPTDTESVQQTFHMFGVACQTIAAASHLIDLMPGNDKWVI